MLESVKEIYDNHKKGINCLALIGVGFLLGGKVLKGNWMNIGYQEGYSKGYGDAAIDIINHIELPKINKRL